LCIKLVIYKNFLNRFRKTQIKNFIKIRPVGSELLNADGRTDGYIYIYIYIYIYTHTHDEANGRLSQFCERAQKPITLCQSVATKQFPPPSKLLWYKFPHTRFKHGRLDRKAKRAKWDVNRTTCFPASFLPGFSPYRQVLSLSGPQPLLSN